MADYSSCLYLFITLYYIILGKKQLESAVLHCLCLLELALQKEVTFMDLLRESQTSLLVSPVEQLLQGVSAQSRQADHITNIARSAFYIYIYIYHIYVSDSAIPVLILLVWPSQVPVPQQLKP